LDIPPPSEHKIMDFKKVVGRLNQNLKFFLEIMDTDLWRDYPVCYQHLSSKAYISDGMRVH